MKAPRRDDYAPYHNLDAFAEGVAAFSAGNYANPYDVVGNENMTRARAPGDGLNAQAWDRGQDYAARVARFHREQV